MAQATQSVMENGNANPVVTAAAADEYVALQKTGRWRRMTPARLELVRKSYAQQVARSASQAVPNQRQRAELKAEIYSHLLPLLELHARAQHLSEARYRRLMLLLGGALLSTTALLVGLLSGVF